MFNFQSSILMTAAQDCWLFLNVPWSNVSLISIILNVAFCSTFLVILNLCKEVMFLKHVANAGHLLRANDAERKPVMSGHFLREGDKKDRNLSGWSNINFNLSWTPPL